MAEKGDLMWDQIESVSTTPPSFITPLLPPLPPPVSPPDLDLGKSAETGIGIGIGGRGGGGKRGRYQDEKTVVICTAETASSLRKDMHTTPLFSRPHLTSYTSLSPPLLPALSCSDASLESRPTVQYSSSVFSLKGMLEAKAALHLDGKVPLNDDSHGIAVRASLGSRESIKGRDSSTYPDGKGVNEGKEKEKEKEIKGKTGTGTGSESIIEEEEEQGEEEEQDDDVPAPHTPKLTSTSTYKKGSRTSTWNLAVEGKGKGNENEQRGEKFNSNINSEGDILPVPPYPREEHSLTQDRLSDPPKSNQTLPVLGIIESESKSESDGKGLKEVAGAGAGDSNRSSVYTKKNSAASSSGNSLSGITHLISHCNCGCNNHRH